ncbi:hypothetical protein [Agriterribacter sp.]|uniref:hypothetical protein n=1 Tax=Agriterribacter sp. TaxID=2821509 RepID=UPI002C8772E6|nr:hypothetical protein [Agriterribacter sp.]HTN09242.1 hypothetical protein [Agriterribacter sp.]
MPLFKVTVLPKVCLPHFKKGKKLYFKRSEWDGWLTELRIDTNAEIEKQAIDYIIETQVYKYRIAPRKKQDA